MTPEQEKRAEGNRRYDERTAKENIEGCEPFELEHQCRQAAKWLGRDEEAWQELIPLLEAIEYGRLYGIRYRPRSQEEIDSWRNYMMNR